MLSCSWYPANRQQPALVMFKTRDDGNVTHLLQRKHSDSERRIPHCNLESDTEAYFPQLLQLCIKPISNALYLQVHLIYCVAPLPLHPSTCEK